MTVIEQPTSRDILAAIQGLGSSYHDLHLTMQGLRAEVGAHRAESKREREKIHDQIIALSIRIDEDWAAMSAKVDLLWQALDDLKRSMVPSDELRRELTELRMRVQDHEERLAALESRRRPRLEGEHE